MKVMGEIEWWVYWWFIVHLIHYILKFSWYSDWTWVVDPIKPNPELRKEERISWEHNKASKVTKLGIYAEKSVKIHQGSISTHRDNMASQKQHGIVPCARKKACVMVHDKSTFAKIKCGISGTSNSAKHEKRCNLDNFEAHFPII